MNNDMETLIKIIIPAILLIFWLLSNMFNRENGEKTARERAAALGTRPPNYPSAKPVDRRTTPMVRTTSQKDEIMVIRAEPNRPGARPNQPARKTQNRGRSSGAQQARKVEATSTSQNRELTRGALVGDVNHSLTRAIGMKALGDHLATESTPPAATSSLTTGTPPASAFDLREALKDPTRIREAFILNEVLQPPLSQRGRRVRSI